MDRLTTESLEVLAAQTEPLHGDLQLAARELLVLRRAVRLYCDVARDARDQWGSDSLWEKWGLSELMVAADGLMDGIGQVPGEAAP